jgi:uncharacterized short protein YbdD (DUF466 family)
VSGLEALGSRAHKTLRAFPRERHFFSPATASPILAVKKKKKQKKKSVSESALKHPDATYHERNWFRRFRLDRRVDGLFHSFGEIVRFDVLLDRHICIFFVCVSVKICA